MSYEGAALWDATGGYGEGTDLEVGSKLYAFMPIYVPTLYYAWFKKSVLGTTLSWSALKTITSYSTLFIGGGIVQTTTSKLIAAIHVYSKNVYALTSDDDGLNWTTTLIDNNQTASLTIGGVAIVGMAGGKAMMLVLNSSAALVSYLFDGSSWGSAVTIATGLASGYSSFSVTSVGDIVDVLFIDSSGNLKHVRYSGSWGSVTTLVSGGCSHPSIVAGSSGRLYAFYVRAGTIKLMKFLGTEWLAEKEAFSGHTYNNPTYLSSNRNGQQGKVCLAWTEKTASPYDVWACNLEE